MPQRQTLGFCCFVAWGVAVLCMARPTLAADLPTNLSPDFSAVQISCTHFHALDITWPAAVKKKGQGRLLYLWSPRMVLSVLHAAAVQQVARQQGLVWVAAADPRVPVDEWQAALAAAPAAAQMALRDSQPLCDVRLLAQAQTLRHFPTAWVYTFSPEAGWQVQGTPIVSAMPPAFWQEAVAERLPKTLLKERTPTTDLPAALKSRAIQ